MAKAFICLIIMQVKHNLRWKPRNEMKKAKSWSFPGDHNTICEKNVFLVSIAKLNIDSSLA